MLQTTIHDARRSGGATAFGPGWFGTLWFGTLALAVLAIASLASALLLSDWHISASQATAPRIVPPVSGAALFDAMAHGGPPGLAAELRAISSLLERGGAGAGSRAEQGAGPMTQAGTEATRRLAAAATRLDQQEAAPVIVLARIADRLDAAMARPRMAGDAGAGDAGMPSRLLLLAAAFGVGAALLGLAAARASAKGDLPAVLPLATPPFAAPSALATLFPSSSRDIAADAPSADVPLADIPPAWAQALQVRLVAAVADACGTAGANRQDPPAAAQSVRAAMLAAAQLAGIALDAETRLDAATRRAEAVLLAADPAGTAQTIQHLDMTAARLDQTARLLAALADAAPPGLHASGLHASGELPKPAGPERLDAQMSALGTHLEGQARATEAVFLSLRQLSDIAARLEAADQAMAAFGAMLPARAEHAVAVMEMCAERTTIAVTAELSRVAAEFGVRLGAGSEECLRQVARMIGHRMQEHAPQLT